MRKKNFAELRTLTLSPSNISQQRKNFGNVLVNHKFGLTQNVVFETETTLTNQRRGRDTNTTTWEMGNVKETLSR